MVRAYRRPAPPELPSNRQRPGQAKPGEPRPLMPLPGVPLLWCEGVALMAVLPAPDTIMPGRWAILAATSRRLLHDHGAALHGAGWGTVDLWGLDAAAPAGNPQGWGLAWLLGEVGDVLDISPDVVGLRLGVRGARMGFRRVHHRPFVLPAWDLRCRPQ